MACPNASITRPNAGCRRFFTLTQCGDRPHFSVPGSKRSVSPILMCGHRRSRTSGVLFANNKPDAAHHATSNDDTVLISGEPEARDIGGRDRIAEDFVISHHHDWSRRVYWNSLCLRDRVLRSRHTE
jgi:hypothetical protein